MEKANAELVAKAIGEKVLETLDQKEQQLDEKIRALERADDDELERIRERRLEQMKQQARKAQELRADGHGKLTLLTDTHEFFDTIKRSEQAVVHFFTASNPFCQVVDDHLGKLAPHHLETRFCQINAEKAEFLVQKLGIWMIPCLALVKSQKVVKMVQGLDELGGSETFSTAFLAYYLSLQGVLKYDGPIPETPYDTCQGAYAGKRNEESKTTQKSSIRQTVYYDSDLDEDDLRDDP